MNDTLYDCAAGDCNNLVLNAVESFTPYIQLIGELPPPPIDDIAAGLESGTVIYLAHVRFVHIGPRVCTDHLILLICA